MSLGAEAEADAEAACAQWQQAVGVRTARVRGRIEEWFSATSAGGRGWGSLVETMHEAKPVRSGSRGGLYGWETRALPAVSR